MSLNIKKTKINDEMMKNIKNLLFLFYKIFIKIYVICQWY